MRSHGPGNRRSHAARLTGQRLAHRLGRAGAHPDCGLHTPGPEAARAAAFSYERHWCYRGLEAEIPHPGDCMCNHGNARLCDGFVEGHEVECPLHQARFDLRTGVPSCGPATQAIQVYPVRVVGDRVLVQVA